jgi:hypothetical protein
MYFRYYLHSLVFVWQQAVGIFGTAFGGQLK